MASEWLLTLPLILGFTTNVLFSNDETEKQNITPIQCVIIEELHNTPVKCVFNIPLEHREWVTEQVQNTEHTCRDFIEFYKRQKS